ncbi:AAA-28 domain-containing protein [Fusarium keratoplasticum]|nr:AAA-28 domain-containing protein [Fusarium keratoplasticum]
MAPDTNIPNIYIIGPQSTGKTTLVNKLRSELENWLADTSIIRPQIVSVARTVLTKHKFTAEEVKSSPNRCLALQQLILEAQALAEKEALQRSSWFISDRSGVDPLVYASKYVSADAALEMQRQSAWIEVKARMSASLIVVCEAGTPWLTDDGVRLMPDNEEAWMQLFHEFCGLLDEVGLQYFVVPRTMLDLSERAQFVRARWVERGDSTKHD